MFNVAYRVFLYSYAYYVICNKNENEESKKLDSKQILKMVKTIFVNPIIIATFIGFILWSLQLIPGTDDINNWWVINFNNKTGAFWNISISLPWIYETMKTLGNLASPMVWIAIGCTKNVVDPNVNKTSKTILFVGFLTGRNISLDKKMKRI